MTHAYLTFVASLWRALIWGLYLFIMCQYVWHVFLHQQSTVSNADISVLGVMGHLPEVPIGTSLMSSV